MIYLYNFLGLVLVTLWNAAVLTGTIWLILEKDWSPWTLAVTILLFIRWKEWEPNKPSPASPEESRIIL